MSFDNFYKISYNIPCQMVGQSLPLGVEESPGFSRTQYRITSGRGDPMDSVTENKPPVLCMGKGEKAGQEPTAQVERPRGTTSPIESKTKL